MQWSHLLHDVMTNEFTGDTDFHWLPQFLTLTSSITVSAVLKQQWKQCAGIWKQSCFSLSGLRQVLFICCFLQNKREQMAESWEQEVFLKQQLKTRPAVTCSFAWENQQGQTVYKVLANYSMQDPWLLLCILLICKKKISYKILISDCFLDCSQIFFCLVLQICIPYFPAHKELSPAW